MKVKVIESMRNESESQLHCEDVGASSHYLDSDQEKRCRGDSQDQSPVEKTTRNG